ncbi:MAG: hypothetical protein LUC37_03055 [Prevotella sp.]|nr:hypothetical protein [Prevotella sp.]
MDPIGYHVSLGMSVPDKPIVICAELEDDKFLEFFKQELKQRSFHFHDYGELNLRDPYLCERPDTSCTKCNEETGAY